MFAQAKLLRRKEKEEEVFEDELEKRLQLADRNRRANTPYRDVLGNQEETGAAMPRVRKRLAGSSLSAPNAKRLKVDAQQQLYQYSNFEKKCLIFVK